MVVAVATPLSAKMSMVPWGEVMVPPMVMSVFGTDRDVAREGGVNGGSLWGVDGVGDELGGV